MERTVPTRLRLPGLFQHPHLNLQGVMQCLYMDRRGTHITSRESLDTDPLAADGQQGPPEGQSGGIPQQREDRLECRLQEEH